MVVAGEVVEGGEAVAGGQDGVAAALEAAAEGVAVGGVVVDDEDRSGRRGGVGGRDGSRTLRCGDGSVTVGHRSWARRSVRIRGDACS